MLKTQNSSLKRLARKMELIQLQLQDDAAAIHSEELKQVDSLRSKQEIEKKKLAQLDKDISTQNAEITEIEKGFNEKKDAKITPLLKEQSQITAKKVSLENEVAELERKLKEKKAELAESVKKLKGVGATLAEVEESFKEEGSKIQERRNKV